MARKRNRQDETDEQHVRSHFGGLYLETEEDAEKVKALVVSNFSQTSCRPLLLVTANYCYQP